jgi:hypothetical protein
MLIGLILNGYFRDVGLKKRFGFLSQNIHHGSSHSIAG